MFGDVADGASRQTEDRRHDVQTTGTCGEDGKILPLQRSESQIVDLLQDAGTLPVGLSDRIIPPAPADPTRGLQPTECPARYPPRPLGDERQDRPINLPSQRFAAMAKQLGQFLVAVILEAKRQLHPVAQGSEQGVFVGRAQQEREARNRNARGRLPTPGENRALVEGEIECGLERSLKLVAFVDVDDVLVPGGQQQGIQVRNGRDGLPQDFVEIGGKFLGDDAGELALAESGRADEQGVVEAYAVLECRVQRGFHLLDDGFLPNQMREGRRDGIVDFRGHERFLSSNSLCDARRRNWFRELSVFVDAQHAEDVAGEDISHDDRYLRQASNKK